MSQEKTRTKRRRKFLKYYLIYRLITLVLFLLAVGGVYLWASADIDRGADEALFRSLGHSTTTRVYAVKDLERFAQQGEIEGDTVSLYDTVYRTENNLWLSSETIPKTLKEAFVAIEDHRFYRHRGVDWLRTLKAGANAVFHFDRRFGGSTITQQVIKNVSGDSEFTFKRKVKEMIRARRLEKAYSKDEILCMYLNVVPLGHSCTGVEAAARYYYGKPARELTTAECAGLAAITNSPARYDPVANREANRQRRDLILEQMHRYGYLSESAMLLAKQETVTLSETALSKAPAVRDWYTETVLREVKQALMARYDLSEAVAGHMVYGGGLKIYAAVDPELQAIAEAAFSGIDNAEIQCAFLLADPKTGRLLAAVGGGGKKKGNLLLNGVTALKRPPGSAIKPVTLFMPAIDKRLVTWSTVFEDVPLLQENGNYWPKNANRVYEGRIPFCDAVAYSKNTVAVRLYEMLGAEEARHAAEQAGLTSLVCEKKDSAGNTRTDLDAAPLALGQLTEGVSLLEMTYAYTPFVNEGMYVSPFCFYEVCDEEGHRLLTPAHKTEPCCSPATAAIMTRLLECVTNYGTASALTLKHETDVAGKTGTSGGGADRWFVGYTPAYLAGIRVSSVDGTSSAGLSQAKMLALWDEIMKAVYAKTDDGSESEPHFGLPHELIYAPFCRDSGELPDIACHADPRCNRVAYGYYLPGTEPKAHCTTHIIAWRRPESGEVLSDYAENAEMIGLLAGEPSPDKIRHKTLDLPYYLWYYKEGAITPDDPASEGTKPKEESPHESSPASPTPQSEGWRTRLYRFFFG